MSRLDTDRAYRERHREQIRERQRAYRNEFRDEINAEQRACRAANRDDVNAKQRAYRAANRDDVNAKQRAYRAANRERFCARVREAHNRYQRTHREMRRARRWIGPSASPALLEVALMHDTLRQLLRRPQERNA